MKEILATEMQDPLILYGEVFHSRLAVGSALYSSPDKMLQSVHAAKAEMVTVSLRRENANHGGGDFFKQIQQTNAKFLPNTAGCHTAKEAVTVAQMGREIFGTDRVKLEVIGRSGLLNPDLFETLEATRILIAEGFKVYPYITEDLSVCERLLRYGCEVLMPWAAPIGTGKGMLNPFAMKNLREIFPHVALIADAGIGLPSHAARIMELGFDGILLNTAIAKSRDPVRMAAAFRDAVIAGRAGYLAGAPGESDLAAPSTPEFGAPFSPFE